MKVSIDYYLTPRAALEFANAILEKEFIVKTDEGTKLLSKVQNGKRKWEEQGKPDKGVFYKTAPGGTEVDGRTLYRIVKLLPANSSDYRLAAYQAPGKRDQMGLIQMAGDYTGYVYVPISEQNLIAFAEGLKKAIHAYDQYKFRNWLQAGGVKPFEGNSSR